MSIDELRDAVVEAAVTVVHADTYTHPMLSRADAVAAGVAALHDAVAALEAAQAPVGLPDGGEP